MEFEFAIVGQGWADARVEDESGRATMTVSHLTDALGDLLHAVWRSGDGDSETRCSWEEEPGEFRWILRRSGGNIAVTILEFDRHDPPRLDRFGRPIIASVQPWTNLARAIAPGASRSISKDNGDDYRDAINGGSTPGRDHDLMAAD